MQWETVIGLEVHVQLATQSKIFSGAATQFGAEPNTQACAVDLGLPGVLPVLNKETLRMAVLFGLSVEAQITYHSVFARKNYFYPDLPKGYQISQHNHPIVGPGHLDIQLDDGTERRIGITRAHLEEDAGKSLHGAVAGLSGIDLNRAGIPLLEIVSEPDMRNAKEAVTYLKTLHTLVRYLGISDANMQEGSFRCDVNLSLRPLGTKKYGTRTEMKNINSFRFVERAIAYEYQRQKEILEGDGTIILETRLYDPQNDETRPMRSKEEAHDYRYFPDPDLLPVVIDDNYIDNIRQNLPELPWEKRARFIAEYDLNHYDAQLLSSNIETAHYFENVIGATKHAHTKIIANWINGELFAALNKHHIKITESPITAEKLAALLDKIADKTISNNIAKQIFETLWNNDHSVDKIIEEKGLKQITDVNAITRIVEQVIANNPEQTAQYRAGKDKLIAFFVGQVMKESKGKANPTQVNQLLKEKLAQS